MNNNTLDSAVAVEAKSVTKIFGHPTMGVKALDSVDLSINNNEFFTLLGPSGCGKTTLLRLIAGFEQLTQGEIFLFDDEIENLPPHERPVNTVFQHYALFPHMTVSENIGFGLKMLKWSPGDIQKRVAETLALVKMEEYAARKPNQMSGGQQQRIALARALAPRPKVLLLDEPLSALDLKLRQQMRQELKSLQEQTGITFIFVTHDQEEALTMSDRIAVMSAGEVQQIGTPLDIYERPVNRFVADFVGDTNFLDAQITGIDGDTAACGVAGGSSFETPVVGSHATGDRVTLAIRPEKIKVLSAPGGQAGGARIAAATYLGTDTTYEIVVNPQVKLVARDQNTALGMGRFAVGDQVELEFADGAARMLVD